MAWRKTSLLREQEPEMLHKSFVSHHPAEGRTRKGREQAGREGSPQWDLRV